MSSEAITIEDALTWINDECCLLWHDESRNIVQILVDKKHVDNQRAFIELYAKASSIDGKPTRAQQMEELLRELVSDGGMRDGICVFCNTDYIDPHEPDCLITRAKQLLEGAE